MPKSYNIPLYGGAFNLAYYLIYATLGSMTTSEVIEKGVGWVFFILRPEYFFVSWAVSVVCIFVAIGAMIKFRKVGLLKNAAALAMNTTYLFLFYKLLMVQ